MTEGAAIARGPWAMIRDRTFGPFFVGKIASSAGIWIQNIAAAVLMYDLTHSAFMVGAVTMVQFLGPLVLAPYTGLLTDRVDRRRLLVLGRSIAGISVLVLSLLLTLFGEGGFGGEYVLLAAVFSMGVGLAFSSPAMHALVPSLVPRQDLEQALALNSAAPSLARTAGPAVGAALLFLAGPALAFGVASLGHLFFIGALMRIRGRPQERPASLPTLLGGVRYLREDRRAGILVVGVALVSFGGDPAITLTPSLADDLGGASWLVGALATAFGVGAVGTSVSIRLLRRWASLRLLGIVGFWTLAAGLACAAMSVAVPLALAGFLLSGAGFMLATVALNTRLQRRIPDVVRGRVMALWGVAFLGTRPLAAFVNGGVAEFSSVRAALLTSAAVCAAASWLAAVREGDGMAP